MNQVIWYWKLNKMKIAEWQKKLIDEDKKVDYLRHDSQMRKKVDWSNYLMKKEVWQRKSINEESKQKVYCRVKSKNEERLIMVTDSASCLVAIATENIYEEEFLSKKSFYQGSKQWWWQQWWTRTRGRWRPSH